MNDYIHRVRNCKDFEEERFRKGTISPKIDGVRAFYYPGQRNLVSRQNKPIYGMDHIMDQLVGVDVCLDMELHIPGLEFNELSGLIRNHNATPEAIGYVFDSPGQGDLRERFDRARGALYKRPALKLVQHYVVKTLPQYMFKHKQFLKEGHEGSVWKSVEHEYLNKRDWNWMRLVPIASEDCEVLDVYEGNGKMAGIAGGILINFKGIVCKCGTMKGLDYAAREELLSNKDYYIGLVAEIQYKNLQPSGKPRQPRFKGWRHDKDSSDL